MQTEKYKHLWDFWYSVNGLEGEVSAIRFDCEERNQVNEKYLHKLAAIQRSISDLASDVSDELEAIEIGDT